MLFIGLEIMEALPREISQLIFEKITAPRDILSLHLTSKRVSQMVYEGLKEVIEPASIYPQMGRYKRNLIITKKPRCIVCRRVRKPNELYCNEHEDRKKQIDKRYAYDNKDKRAIEVLIAHTGLFNEMCFVSLNSVEESYVGVPPFIHHGPAYERLVFCGIISNEEPYMDCHENINVMFSFGFFSDNRIECGVLYDTKEDVIGYKNIGFIEDYLVEFSDSDMGGETPFICNYPELYGLVFSRRAFESIVKHYNKEIYVCIGAYRPGSKIVIELSKEQKRLCNHYGFFYYYSREDCVVDEILFEQSLIKARYVEEKEILIPEEFEIRDKFIITIFDEKEWLYENKEANLIMRRVEDKFVCIGALKDGVVISLNEEQLKICEEEYVLYCPE